LALRVAQFVGQGQDQLPGKLGVAAALGLFDRVPQFGPVACPGGSPCGREDFGVQDTVAPPVVVNFAGAFVFDPLARPIRGGGGRAITFAAPDDFGAEAVEGHGGKSPRGIARS
jgi:hypothetical protein